MRVAWPVAVMAGAASAAACGRIGFDTTGAASTACTDDAGSGCTAAGPPPVGRCGDGICETGELCGGCSDCRTTAAVCGNGACEAGEDSASCVADCGPSPWPWTADEQTAISDLNYFRSGDFGCPMGPTFYTPPLPEDPSLQAAAREWAWEIAHQGYLASDDSRCNGRTLHDLEAATGVTYVHVVAGFATEADMLQAWENDPVACPDLLEKGSSGLEIAIAVDARSGFVVLFK